MLIKDLVNLIRRNKVRRITCNSKTVRKNDVFIAVDGIREDGTSFINEAVSNGARIIVCNAGYNNNSIGKVSLVKVKNTRLAIAELASEFYRGPSNKLKAIGVTGTNGKTTITYLLEHMLKESGFKPGVIGTVNYRFNNVILPAKNTTPGPLELQSMLARMLRDKIDYAALEVSSHSLDQNRVFGINFHSAIFTNLTQDHLDYHKTIPAYFLAKSKLFSGLSKKAFAVLNRDDKYFDKLKMRTQARVITYGLKDSASIRASKIKYSLNGTEFILVYPQGKINLKTPLIGQHNVYNILAAFAWGYKEGLALKDMKKAIENFFFVPGRLERIKSKSGFYVFVDYAHTEDALKNVLISLRGLSPNRVISVFGCGGERDKLKRPLMGKVASELSDQLVLTNDNPRSEKPREIIKDIIKGISKDNYVVIPNRGAAIKHALVIAKSGDIVLIAGKGHENYQIMGNKRMHFNDCEEVRSCLR
jgi:UDP-N-acetylmuramoyl-L-alanyl-D-glutamate--2,6-diaminopimelate ligase